MTSDMGETFDAMKKEGQARRASNRDRSAQMLTDAGIAFISKNDGAHLVVAGGYDFWPGTGLWKPIGGKTRNRGVHKLIAKLKKGTP